MQCTAMPIPAEGGERGVTCVMKCDSTASGPNVMATKMDSRVGMFFRKPEEHSHVRQLLGFRFLAETFLLVLGEV